MTITSVSDDIDGTPDAEPVTFGFQGVAYSIDLAEQNLIKLTKAFAPFIDHAARHRGAGLSVVGGEGRAKAKAKAERPYEISDLREWAGKNKIKVAQRGRIRAAVVEQCLAAGGS